MNLGLREKKEIKTRKIIFEIALEKFCKDSIEGTRLREIAEEAEIAERTLYRYYPSKEILAKELYIDNLNFIRKDDICKKIADHSNIEMLKHNMDLFKDEIIAGIRNYPERLLYDLFYNTYAARHNEDPTQYDEHFLQFDWYKQINDSMGRKGALISDVLMMLLSYAQRLVMLENQKSEQNWNEVCKRFESVYEISWKGVLEQLSSLE